MNNARLLSDLKQLLKVPVTPKSYNTAKEFIEKVRLTLLLDFCISSETNEDNGYSHCVIMYKHAYTSTTVITFKNDGSVKYTEHSNARAYCLDDYEIIDISEYFSTVDNFITYFEK